MLSQSGQAAYLMEFQLHCSKLVSCSGCRTLECVSSSFHHGVSGTARYRGGQRCRLFV